MNRSTDIRVLDSTDPSSVTVVDSVSSPPTSDLRARESAALKDLLRLVAERACEEKAATEARDSGLAKVQAESEKTGRSIRENQETLDREARAGDESRRRAIVDAAIAGEAKAKADFGAASRKIAAEFDAARESAKVQYSRARNDANSRLEQGNRKALAVHKEALKPLNEAAKLADSYRGRLAALVANYKKFQLTPEPPPPTRETYTKFSAPVDELFDRLAKLDAPLKLLEGLVIPKSMKGANEAWVFILPLIVFVGLAIWLEFNDVTGLVCFAIVGLALGGALRVWLVNLSKTQLQRLYVPLMQSLADSDGLREFNKNQVEKQLSDERKRLAIKNQSDLDQAKSEHERAIAGAEAHRDERLRAINEEYAKRMVDIQTTQSRDMSQAIEAHAARMAEIPARAERERAKLDDQSEMLRNQLHSRFDRKWTALSERWFQGMNRVSTELSTLSREIDEIGPPWESPAWTDRRFPAKVPPVLPFGTVTVDLKAIPDGISREPKLMDGLATRFELPTFRAFPSGANLLIETPPEGRGAAVEALQAAMFRMLTSLPPAATRFTIIDPIGIGRNFGAFMHLADFDPVLVNNQVWTDARQIEERLAELEAHMETVTQKYLRNEYATIEEYNAVAGEVAEPYRVLVIADFPTKFDEKMTGRLAAIAAGGVPCGVLVLMAVDTSKAMPPGFGLGDIRPYCAHLTWKDGGLVWDDPELSRFPLRLDPPPPAEFATKQIQKLGAAAKDARRVMVPFSYIAPSDHSWWTQDSRGGIDIPLGKSGATKRQNLTLGQGTSQHVLIAGRTGSGKSTLMHAMITNLALNYSPDQVDLYLIDFKKGVEFKIYATHELPHASVVAIESEREFGVSVLQRLDKEMTVRADRFREAGVQDLNGYRDTPGTPPMPRILLIVDEFQEFFVEEDRLAQEAALLLDRLVRQGRAFGLHVHLGSQSLGGAFTLARSTLGQMAVRIALQCSEVDSLLILAENNLAAKWLSRPGEAIYNDANGAPEGNHFFQVVWLPDEAREAYLEQIHAKAEREKPVLARTPIVFEGDAPARLDRNPLFAERLTAATWPETPRSATAWLGDAIAIKDPTAALFRRQGGNHLLIVGQNDEAAIGVTAATLISLASQFSPAPSATKREGAKFFILDGTPEDHPDAEKLGKLAGQLPHGVKAGGWRDIAETLSAVAGEIALRQLPDGGDGPEIFVFIHDLARFRELRRKEDDFGFGPKGDDATPPDLLDTILRDGPSFGVHLITWCDTLNNLNRYFTHQQLRELGMRVLFQMSPNDSGALLDSPAASKLGRNRALFATEEQNQLEKFRPYALPDASWFATVAKALSDRPRTGE